MPATTSEDTLEFQWSPYASRITLVGPLRSSDPSVDANRAINGLDMKVSRERGFVDVDLAQADDFDASGIGFLVTFNCQLSEKGVRARFLAVSPRLRGLCELLGIAGEFGLQRKEQQPTERGKHQEVQATQAGANQ